MGCKLRKARGGIRFWSTHGAIHTNTAPAAEPAVFFVVNPYSLGPLFGRLPITLPGLASLTQPKGAAMSKIIITYRLKDGVTQDAYETWTRTRDYPTMRGLSRVASFVNHRVTGMLLDPNAKAPVDYVEVFDVPDLAGFMAEDFGAAAVQAILGEFMGFAEDPQIMVAEAVV